MVGEETRTIPATRICHRIEDGCVVLAGAVVAHARKVDETRVGTHRPKM